MAKLGDQHIERARKLRQEGKSIREIVEDVEDLEKTFGIKTYAAAVTKVVADVKKEKGSKKAKRAYHKGGPKDVDEASLDRMMKDIQILLKEVPEGYKKVIRHVRVELIKSRAEVYQMLTGAGIVIPESPIK